MSEQNATAIRIPEVHGLPGIGSLLSFKRNKLAFFTKLARLHGDICCFHLGPRRIVFINNAEYVNYVLAETEQSIAFQRPGPDSLFATFMGQGLLYRDGASHKFHRKKLIPLLQPHTVAQYATTIAAMTESVQREWADGAVLELFDEMLNIAMRVLGNTLFPAGGMDDMVALRAIAESVSEHLSSEESKLLRLPAWIPTPKRLRFRKQLEQFRAITLRMIDAGRGSEDEHRNLISTLLHILDEQGRPLTNDQIRGDLMAFYLGGHKSSAKLLCRIFYLLMQQPNVYARLHEINSQVLDGKKICSNIDDLKHLDYNLQIIKETLRLHPPAHIMIRRTATAIQLGEYRVPENTLIFICPYTLHRDSRYFLDPEEFKPERFADDMEKRLPRSAFIPFGGGPRICIGSHFAMLVIQIVLVTLTQQLKFELLPGQRLEPGEPSLWARSRKQLLVRVRRHSAP